MADQPFPRFRRRWHFPLWALMAFPVVCAPLFLLLAELSREPQDLWERECRWCTNPLGRRFFLDEGEEAVPTYEVVQYSQVEGPDPQSGHYFGHTRLITSDGWVRALKLAGAGDGGEKLPEMILKQLPAAAKIAALRPGRRSEASGARRLPSPRAMGYPDLPPWGPPTGSQRSRQAHQYARRHVSRGTSRSTSRSTCGSIPAIRRSNSATRFSRVINSPP